VGGLGELVQAASLHFPTPNPAQLPAAFQHAMSQRAIGRFGPPMMPFSMQPAPVMLPPQESIEMKKLHAKQRKNTLAAMPMGVVLSFSPLALNPSPPEQDLSVVSTEELQKITVSPLDPESLVLVAMHIQGARVQTGSDPGGAGHLCVQNIHVGRRVIQQRIEFMARASFQRRAERKTHTGKANELRKQEPCSLLIQRVPDVAALTIAPNANANPSHYRALHYAVRGMEKPLAQRAYGMSVTFANNEQAHGHALQP